MSPNEAKNYGKSVGIFRDAGSEYDVDYVGAPHQLYTLAQWDRKKLSVMSEILLDKFVRDPALYRALIDTGEKHLEESNWWGDVFWGTCEGTGENNLGKCLMSIREQLQGNNWGGM